MKLSPTLSSLSILWILTIGFVSFSYSLEEVSGANATLETMPSAQNAGLGAIRSSAEHYLGDGGFDPTSILSIQGHQIELAHSEEFGGGSYDWIAWGGFVDSTHQSVLSLQFSRYYLGDIKITEEGPIYEGTDIPRQDISDYVLTGVWATQYRFLEYGMNFHALYRQHTQEGVGFRLDGAVSSHWLSNYRTALIFQGFSSSATKWESDQLEYSPLEIFMTQKWSQHLPFFYGRLSLLWQSAGFIHNRANRLLSQGRDGLDQNFGNWLGGSHLGTEFHLDNGVIVRSGLQNADEFKTWTAGVGVKLLSRFQADYGMQSHSELGRIHRVSLSYFIEPRVDKLKFK